MMDYMPSKEAVLENLRIDARKALGRGDAAKVRYCAEMIRAFGGERA